MKHLLGCGLLSWPQNERITGRYGLIALFRPPTENEDGLQALPWNTDALLRVTGAHGTLIAVKDDQDIILGEGELFAQSEYGQLYVGIHPDDNRKEEWLDSSSLYKVDGYLIHRDIDLYFQPLN